MHLSPYVYFALTFAAGALGIFCLNRSSPLEIEPFADWRHILGAIVRAAFLKLVGTTTLALSLPAMFAICADPAWRTEGVFVSFLLCFLAGVVAGSQVAVRGKAARR